MVERIVSTRQADDISATKSANKRNKWEKRFGKTQLDSAVQTETVFKALNKYQIRLLIMVISKVHMFIHTQSIQAFISSNANATSQSIYMWIPLEKLHY